MNRRRGTMRKIEPVPPVEPSTPARLTRPRLGYWARMARIGLPLAALGLAALIFTWSRINPIIERIHLSDTEEVPEEIDSITMENARFAGVDAQNRTFNVTAVRAVQSIGDSNLIELQQPKANIVLANGTKVDIQSDTGGLQRDTQVLDLLGAVTLTQDRGYEYRTTKARIDLRQKTAMGDAPVEGRGPQGEIYAEGFEIADNGARVVFRGRSRAVFQPEATP